MRNLRITGWRYGFLACLVALLVTFVTPAIAQSPVQSPQMAHQLGQQAYDRGQLTQAVEHWQGAMQAFGQQGDVRSQALTAGHLALAYQDLGDRSAATTTLDRARQLAQPLDDDFVSAQLLMAQGTQRLHQGQGAAALTLWQQAEALYWAIADDAGRLQSQLNQAQALQLLGNHLQAFQQLQQLAESIHALPPSALKVQGLQNLGATLQAIGQWQPAQETLSESLSLAQQLQLSGPLGEIHLSFGNLLRAQDDLPGAIQHYQQAAIVAVNPATQLTAQLNRLKLLVAQDKTEDALALLSTIQRLLTQLPPSRNTVYAQVNLADSLITLSQAPSAEDPALSPLAIAQGLSTAIDHARTLNDPKAEAYALGELGHMYERNQQWPEALDLTRTATRLAQVIQAEEIAMPWLWQQGRILRAQGDQTGAIAAYSQAVATLKDLRQDLVALSPDIQFSFREQVEPVYRQLVQLLLTDVDTLPDAEQQARLGQSRQLVEDLQLATLDNFFRQACVAAAPRTIDQIDPTAAVIYPILLDQDGEQRLEVIVSVSGPGQGTRELIHYGRAIAPGEAQKLFETLQATLTPLYRADEILPTAQTLYQWLIEPAESLLAKYSIQTLVFVPDGFLRNVPMAVLHDGEQFLVERYALALSPGLQLLPSTSQQPLDIADQPQTLASGLSTQRPGFAALPNVEMEIEQVQQLTPTATLLNQTFNTANLQAQLQANAFPILHLATHGQFSSNLEETFLLTWDDRLSIQALEALLAPQEYRQPIELLILSACQTARGDDQAALGLAGIAVRAGARSIVSTLWSVADASTAQFITHFYQNLTQQTTKAGALRQAQLSLLHAQNYNHPYFWAPFVLVGNWQ
ncbi:MAG: CHAT domain-containing protein [Cyanobacteria bacterium J06635_1]